MWKLNVRNRFEFLLESNHKLFEFEISKNNFLPGNVDGEAALGSVAAVAVRAPHWGGPAASAAAAVAAAAAASQGGHGALCGIKKGIELKSGYGKTSNC